MTMTRSLLILAIVGLDLTSGFAMGRHPASDSASAQAPGSTTETTGPAGNSTAGAPSTALPTGGSAMPGTSGNAGYYGSSGATTPGTTAAPTANTANTSR